MNFRKIPLFKKNSSTEKNADSNNRPDKKPKSKKDRLTNWILGLVFLAGLGLLCYPTVANWWNESRSSRAFANYDTAVESLDRNKLNRIWEDAQNYNDSLNTVLNRYDMSEEDLRDYNSQLNIDNNGQMGRIEIPKIHLKLPIYHTVEEPVLQVAAGHVPGSSLPVGGEGTHTVLSGHRGLPSAKLFTDLDELEEGDIFVLKILDKTLTYEVDKISIVEPDETEGLLPVAGKDYCTLVTCTPYGVNTQRLLIRGVRTTNDKAAPFLEVGNDVVKIDPMLVAPVVMVILFIALGGATWMKKVWLKKKKSTEKSDSQNS